MMIDDLAVTEELRAAFEGYEEALMRYDPAALDAYFWRDARVVRFGVAENLYGYNAISAYRRTRTSVPARTLENTRIVALGSHVAIVNTEFRYPGDARTGRQSQTWARLSEGWRIVAAHVSFKEDVEK